MEFERNHASGVAKAGLTTGIIGTSLGALGVLGGGAGLLGTLMGGNRGSSVNVGMAGSGQSLLDGLLIQAVYGNAGRSTCESDHYVTRFDAEKDAEIAKLKADIALRDADTYTDKKMLELYQYVDGRMRGVEGQIAQQAVQNQAVADQFKLVQQEQQCCCNAVKAQIQAECEARKCADNSIVSYANATFYPKQVADVTTGTATTAQMLYNPLPQCGCGC